MIDSYDRQARLAPALLVLLPIAVGSMPWLTDDQGGWSLWKHLGITGAATLAVATLLMQLTRAIGKRKEPALWDSWGGSPAVALLRHDNHGLPPLTRARYHRMLATALGLERSPTADEERNNPQAADEVYKAAVEYLISQTRDVKTFSLLYRENINYGFHRNLWALRGLGLTFSIIGLALGASRLWFEAYYARRVSVIALISTLFCAAFILVWATLITRDWVRVPAVAYARNLLAASELLSGGRP